MIPKKIKVGAYNYEIKWERDLSHGDDSCFGLCDKSSQVISLKEGIDGVRLKEVLLHEIFHACEESWGFNMSEEQINSLGLAFTTVLIDNPKFARFLIEKSTGRRTRRKG